MTRSATKRLSAQSQSRTPSSRQSGLLDYTDKDVSELPFPSLLDSNDDHDSSIPIPVIENSVCCISTTLEDDLYARIPLPYDVDMEQAAIDLSCLNIHIKDPNCVINPPKDMCFSIPRKESLSTLLDTFRAVLGNKVNWVEIISKQDFDAWHIGSNTPIEPLEKLVYERRDIKDDNKQPVDNSSSSSSPSTTCTTTTLTLSMFTFQNGPVWLISYMCIWFAFLLFYAAVQSPSGYIFGLALIAHKLFFDYFKVQTWSCKNLVFASILVAVAFVSSAYMFCPFSFKTFFMTYYSKLFFLG